MDTNSSYSMKLFIEIVTIHVSIKTYKEAM
jgi:hypothetical protein